MFTCTLYVQTMTIGIIHLKKKCNPINTQIWLISTLISLFKQTVKIQYD